MFSAVTQVVVKLNTLASFDVSTAGYRLNDHVGWIVVARRAVRENCHCISNEGLDVQGQEEGDVAQSSSLILMPKSQVIRAPFHWSQLVKIKPVKHACQL